VLCEKEGWQRNVPRVGDRKGESEGDRVRQSETRHRENPAQ